MPDVVWLDAKVRYGGNEQIAATNPNYVHFIEERIFDINRGMLVRILSFYFVDGSTRQYPVLHGTYKHDSDKSGSILNLTKPIASSVSDLTHGWRNVIFNRLQVSGLAQGAMGALTAR